jgi:hypothetical protein
MLGLKEEEVTGDRGKFHNEETENKNGFITYYEANQIKKD